MGTPHIPAVKVLLGLDAVGGSCFGAPGCSVSAQNMKATNTIQCVVTEYNLMTNTLSYTLLAIQLDHSHPPQNLISEVDEKRSSLVD